METKKNTGLPEIQTNDDEILFISAKEVKVSDEASFLAASDTRIKLSNRLKENKNILNKVCDERHRLHKESTAHRTEKLAPYVTAIAVIDPKLNLYEKEEKRKADESAKLLQIEAQKQVEAEQIAEAEALEASGHKDEAEAIISEPVRAPYIPPVSAPLKVAGIAKNVNWKFEIIDISKLNPQFLIPNEKAIGALVRSLKSQAPNTVGAGAIRVWSEETRRNTGR